MPNEHVEVILGQEDLQEISSEIVKLQKLGKALQAVGLQAASDTVMASCRKMSDILNWNSCDVRADNTDTGRDAEAVHALR